MAKYISFSHYLWCSYVICACLIEETLEQKDKKSSLLKLIPSYLQHLTNPSFMLATVASGIIFAALLYIS